MSSEHKYTDGGQRVVDGVPLHHECGDHNTCRHCGKSDDDAPCEVLERARRQQIDLTSLTAWGCKNEAAGHGKCKEWCRATDCPYYREPPAKRSVEALLESVEHAFRNRNPTDEQWLQSLNDLKAARAALCNSPAASGQGFDGDGVWPHPIAGWVLGREFQSIPPADPEYALAQGWQPVSLVPPSFVFDPTPPRAVAATDADLLVFNAIRGDLARDMTTHPATLAAFDRIAAALQAALAQKEGG